MTYKKFVKLIDKYFDVRISGLQFRNYKDTYFAHSVYLKVDSGDDRVRLDITYRKKYKTWDISKTSWTYTQMGIHNSHEKFSQIIEHLYSQLIDEKTAWYHYWKNNYLTKKGNKKK